MRFSTTVCEKRRREKRRQRRRRFELIARRRAQAIELHPGGVYFISCQRLLLAGRPWLLQVDRVSPHPSSLVRSCERERENRSSTSLKVDRPPPLLLDGKKGKKKNGRTERRLEAVAARCRTAQWIVTTVVDRYAAHKKRTARLIQISAGFVQLL